VPGELATALRSLEPALGALEGEPVARAGGLTNPNNRVTLGGAPLVVRLCGKRTGPLGIDRDTECLAAERASELGIGPPVVARLPAEGVLVCAFVDGAPLEQQELRRPQVLAEVARALRAFHGGPPLPTAFAVFRLLADQGGLGAAVPPDHEQLLALAHRIERALAAHPEHAPVPCHNDLLRANLLRTADGLRLVDWEYAGMNDRYFDLGNLAANNGLGDEDEHALLAAYWGEPATPRRLAALGLMRFVSDFREAMWGLAQTVLSDLDVDYAAYAGEHFARLRERAGDPRVGTWLAQAAGES
jgi:aminoglycoside phosphotransferase (APT) family kinase protein